LDTLCNLVKEKYGKNKIFLVTEDIVYNLYKNTIINLQEKLTAVFLF
jgi:hypothetical protein